MEAVGDCFTIWGTPMSQNTDAAEKGGVTPLLADHRATYPLVEIPPPKRSWVRKTSLHLIHFAIIAGVFYFFVPCLLLGDKFHHSVASTSNITDWGYEDYSPSPKECVTRADWICELHVPPRYGQFHHYAHTSFDLPRSSSLLEFFSRGVLSHGSIEIVNDGTDPNKVTVEVDLSYNLDDVFDRVNVCMIQRGDGKNGIGIFSPRYHSHSYIQGGTRFVVKVHLPVEEGLQRYEGLATDMPSFTHVVGDLGTNVFFDSITLKTTNAPINVKSLSAESATLITTNDVIRGAVNATITEAHPSNGLIEGDINAYNISIITSNSPIVVRLNLLNSYAKNLSNALFYTTNAPIDSQVTLISKTILKTGGAFNVTAITNGSPIIAMFPLAPAYSKLDFSAQTSNGSIWTKLHPTFDGSFTANTTALIQPTLVWDPAVLDPAFKGRHREVTVSRKGSGMLAGETHWLPTLPDDAKGTSKAQMNTTNAAISVNL